MFSLIVIMLFIPFVQQLNSSYEFIKNEFIFNEKEYKNFFNLEYEKIIRKDIPKKGRMLPDIIPEILNGNKNNIELYKIDNDKETNEINETKNTWYDKQQRRISFSNTTLVNTTTRLQSYCNQSKNELKFDHDTLYGSPELDKKVGYSDLALNPKTTALLLGTCVFSIAKLCNTELKKSSLIATGIGLSAWLGIKRLRKYEINKLFKECEENHKTNFPELYENGKLLTSQQLEDYRNSLKHKITPIN